LRRKANDKVVQDKVFQVSFLFEDYLHRPLMLNLVYVRKELDYRFILATILNRKNQEQNFKYSFGYTREKTLPVLEETDNGLSFIFEAPKDIQEIMNYDNSKDSLSPVIKIFLPKCIKNKWLGSIISFMQKFLFMLGFTGTSL